MVVTLSYNSHRYREVRYGGPYLIQYTKFLTGDVSGTHREVPFCDYSCEMGTTKFDCTAKLMVLKRIKFIDLLHKHLY